MWGLILKDIYVNKKSLITTLIVTVLASGLFFIPVCIPNLFTEDTETDGIDISMILPLFQTMAYAIAFLSLSGLVLTFISLDENNLWYNYITSSPVGVKGQIQSKYCEGILSMLLCVYWCFFMTQFAYLINEDASTSMFNLAIMFAFVQLLVLALEIPFVVRFGAKFGDYIKMGIVLAIFIVVLVYILYGINTQNLLYFIFDKLLNDTLSDGATLLTGLFPYIASVLYYLSYRVSCKLYLKGAENFE